MRKLFLLFVVMLTVQSWATISVLQKCPTAGIAGGNNSGTTVTCTFTGANTNPSTIIVFGSSDLFSGTLSISDTVNSYTAVGFTTTHDTASNNWDVWCASNTSTSTLTLTLTSSGTVGNAYVGAIELSGASCTVDTQISTGIAGLTSDTFSTSNANDIIIAFAAGGNGGTAPTAGAIAGTTGTLIGGTNSGARNPGWEYRIVSATQSSQTAAVASATGSVYMQVAAYEAASAGAVVRHRAMVIQK